MIRLRVLRRFRDEEDGNFTLFGAFLVTGFMLVGGLAVDLTYAMKTETEVQGVADAAAHAALVSRQSMTADEARAVAIGIVERTLPPETYGTVVSAADIRFGIWDKDARMFHARDEAASAVLVTAHRTDAGGNPALTFLLRMVGLTHWNITRTSLYARGLNGPVDPCLKEGLMAEGIIDLQSNNNFFSGICVYADRYVSLRNNNYFAANTVVGMPDPAQLDIPSSGFRKNPGLEAALRKVTHHLDVQSHAEAIIAGLFAGDPAVTPGYIHLAEPAIIDGGTVTAAKLTHGAIHIANCDGSGRLTVPNRTTLSNAVILSDCQIAFGSNVTLDNVVFATTSRADRAVTSASGLNVGAGEDCAVEGNAKIISLGGMDFAAKLTLNGGQLIAAKNVAFAANGNAIMGASVLAGGNIDGTSNTQIGYCGKGMDDSYAWPTEQPVYVMAG